MATNSPPPPGIPEASRLSTQTWQSDLLQLFHNAKDRFPDVVWETTSRRRLRLLRGDYGHKAIVYARAPPSFQARYFSFRPPPISSPTPYSASPSPAPAQSSVSLTLTLDYAHNSRSPSPYRSSSPSPSTNQGSILPLFSNELEYLYTGKGLGEAFEFLFDTSESRDVADGEENRIDKLRKDLVYMWRSRLYSDIRISLSGTFSTSNPEHTTAIFSSHRFILVSRSPYFRAQLLTWGKAAIADGSSAPGEPFTVTLPSPPFTPASLHFTLGYIYTGTLVFSHRTYDLDTAFAILRSADYLSLPQLYNETQARVVYEMLHGLYHAFLEFDEYERITNAKWGIGGCRCRQCARRVPRILDFALSDDVANNYLERGARRALVGLFGEGWCNSDFAALPQKIRDSVVKGVSKRTTPTNAFSLLFAAQHAIKKLNAAIDAWADVSREMVLTAQKTIDECLVKESEMCFEQPEWVEMLEGDGAGFEDGERVGWVMESLKRGMSERYAATVYQTLVSNILLRPHATETDATMLSQSSSIRAQVEDARVDLLRWIRKRGGFDTLEGWSIKEISQEIDVPVEDLISPAPHHTLRNPHLSRALRPSLIRGDGNLASSGSSIRSVARSTATLTPPGSARVRNHSTTSRASERPDSKLTPDSASFVSARTGATEKARAHGHVVGHRRSPSTNTTSTRSDDRDSRASEKDDDGDGDDDHDGSTPTPSVTTTPNGRPTLSKIITNNTSSTRSTSLGSKQSTHPVRARHPAIRGSTHQSSHHTTNGLSTLRIPSAMARPSSSLSSATSDTTFRTAPSELITPTSARSRKTSGGSTLSTVSTRTVGTTAKKGPLSNAIGSGPGGALTARTRVASGVSIASTRTPVRHPDKDTAKISPGSAVKRLPSAGRTTPVAQKKSLGRNVVEKNTSQKSSPSPSPRIRRVEIGKERGPKSDNDKENVLSVSPAESLVDDDDDTETNLHTVYTAPEAPEQGADPVITPSPMEDDQTSDDTLAGRESSETVVTSTRTPETKSSPELTLTESTLASAVPSGATLDIGIPCIISSKRKRFRAFARYIGEVLGESGPWVGVEVPIDAWVGDVSDGRAWCDGSWGGIRYFDIGGNGSEWEFGAGDDTRAPRRRKTEWSNGMSTFKGSGGTKREGDQLHVGLDRMKRMRSASPAASDLSTSESMGLFVRPQQVLYVVDAVGADL
ncbi:hypothetical protein EV363DRAFT_1316965 [Boletus edulis]|nr:hypothetical protein EV363DRAFT_1316965 [Boletus edulis]